MRNIILLYTLLFSSSLAVYSQEANAGPSGDDNRSYQINAGSVNSNVSGANILLSGSEGNAGGDISIESGAAEYPESSGDVNIKTKGGFRSGSINIETGSASASGAINLKAGHFKFLSYIQGTRMVSFALDDLERFSKPNTPGIKFGIGTYSPQDKLHLGNLKDSQGLTFASKFKIRQSLTSNNHFVMENIAPNGNLYLRSRIEGNTSGNLILNDKGGNVGIGITNPRSQLHTDKEMRSNEGFVISDVARLRKTGASDFNMYATKKMILSAGGSGNHLLINEDGNIGIGPSSPNRKLEISDSKNSYLRVSNVPNTPPGGRSTLQNAGIELGTYNHGGEYSQDFLINRVANLTYCGNNDIVLKKNNGGAITYTGNNKIYINANPNVACSGDILYGGEVILGTTATENLLVGNLDSSNLSKKPEFTGPLVEDYTFGVNGKSYVNGTLAIGHPSAFENGFPEGYTFYAAEGVLTEKVKVSLKNTADWSDYVFNNDYKLRSLEEVEYFINKSKHLPDVPSAEEVVEKGIDVAKMDAILLQKIEELTLYTIQQEKKIKEIEQSNAKVELLESKLELQSQQINLLLEKLNKLQVSK